LSISSLRAGGEVRKDVTVSEADLQSLDGSRGEAHFVMKWPFSREQAYIKIVAHKKVRPCYEEQDAGSFVPVLAMECRNLEPIAWHCGVDFSATSAGNNTVFQEVDLSDKDWAEFDEENDLSVSITNLEYKIEVTH
jgi:hypothetical protein